MRAALILMSTVFLAVPLLAYAEAESDFDHLKKLEGTWISEKAVDPKDATNVVYKEFIISSDEKVVFRIIGKTCELEQTGKVLSILESLYLGQGDDKNLLPIDFHWTIESTQLKKGTAEFCHPGTTEEDLKSLNGHAKEVFVLYLNDSEKLSHHINGRSSFVNYSRSKEAN